jgi:hypothetical protein
MNKTETLKIEQWKVAYKLSPIAKWVSVEGKDVFSDKEEAKDAQIDLTVKLIGAGHIHVETAIFPLHDL